MPVITKNKILEKFREFGIKSGDKFILHSSLKSLGNVDGGADAVIDAMIESVSPGGTVFVPTSTFGKPFNLTESTSEVGWITEVFRKRPDAIRSFHPSHSIAGIGPDAARILADHEKTTPMGPGSPLIKLAAGGGYIMLIGATHVGNSTVHAAHELAQVPFLNTFRDITVYDGKGGSFISRSLIPGCSSGFNNVEPLLVEKHAIQFEKIGDATTRWMKGQDIIDIALEAVKNDLSFLLCDRPDCGWCTHAREILGILRGQQS
ncbi:MAG: AAC(3) family N-acetyltransferase [Candidatus Latescibacteria bacterium]|nr:AAC(3) family N-acetyltransferase [Candidatus Latescibacterota bacterium]